MAVRRGLGAALCRYEPSEESVAKNGEPWWKWAAGLAVTILVSMGFFGWLGDQLKAHGQALLGATLVALGSVLREAAWPVAAALVLYWLLGRQIRRALAERGGTFRGGTISGLPDTGLRPGDLNWALPHDILYVEMRLPTFRRSVDLKFTAEFWVGTHQRLPEGTQIVEWSLKFNLGGKAPDEWTFKKKDIDLQSVGCTQLYPAPEIFIGDIVLGTPEQQHLQLPVSCEVFLLVRVPGTPGEVKLNDTVPTQICRVQ